MATATKPIKKKAPASADAPQVIAGEIELIPIKMIDRHPLNRTVSGDSVKDLAELIREHGQLEPGRVRYFPLTGRYQLLSGERRFVACQVAGRELYRAVVLSCDDATALAEVALGNAGRKDLDPIERGEMLEHLTRSVAEGGGGLSKIEAGKLFGLTSEGGVRNAIRLCKLSPALAAHVRSGLIPERAARKLVPYAVSNVIMDAIAKDFERMLGMTDQAEFYDTIGSLTDNKESMPYWIQDLVRQCSRPVEKGDRDGMGYGSVPRECHFPDPEKDARLEIVELPAPSWNSKKGATWKRALNCELWDSLNKPFEKAKPEKGKPSKVSADGKVAKRTPAQEAADEKRRAKEAEERLNSFSEDWVCRMLRCTIAKCADQTQVFATLPWLLSVTREVSFLSDAVYRENGCNSRDSDLTAAGSIVGLDAAHRVVRTLWQLSLWPVSASAESHRYGVLTKCGELPEKLAHIDRDDVHELAKLCGASIESAWQRAATPGTDQRRLVQVWLLKHTKAQLHELRAELNVTEGSQAMGREELADCILNAHRVSMMLPVPNRIASRVKGKAKKKGKS